MPKYKLVEADREKWNQIMSESPQFTIFTDIRYLDAVGRKYKNYFVFKGDQIRAGVSVILTEDESGCEIDDLVIYNGIMFLPVSDKKTVRKRFEEFEITEFVIEEFDKRFNKIEMSLNPFFEDLRLFLWHNYHSLDQRDKFMVNLKYTSFLDISELKDAQYPEKTNRFKEMEAIRQRNIKEAREKRVITKVSKQPDYIFIFLDFYKDLIAKQGKVVSDSKLNRMNNLILQLCHKDLADIFITGKEKEIYYITIFCWDKYRSYYLFGAGNPMINLRFKGTLCFWDAFIYLAKQRNIKIVDMEGVNSPQRGWFKLSFGGNLKKYFQVKKNKT